MGAEKMMGEAWIYWSDTVVLYSTMCFGLLAILGAMAVWPAIIRKTSWHGAALYIFTLCGFIFAARWPGLFYFTSFNVDEAQILAAAQALMIDPIYFRGAESGSSGPMVVYPLLASLLLGQEPSYFSTRIVGLVMLAGTATAFYGICRLVVIESIARVAALAPVTLLALTNYWDFVHYTSEHAPVFYLFAGFYFAAYIAFSDVLSWRRLIASGVLGAIFFSIVPFAKLQGTYLALFGGLLLVAAVFLRGGFSFRQRLLAAGITMAASVVLPAVLALTFAVGGVFDYFLNSYLGNALAYQASGLSDVNSWQLLGKLLAKSSDATTYAVGWVVFLLLATASLLTPSAFRLRKQEVTFLAVSFLLLALAMSAVLTTQRDYGHYLIFLPFFAALLPCGLAGALVQRARRLRTSKRDAANYELTCAGLMVLITILPVAGLRMEQPNGWAGNGRAWAKTASKPHTPVGNAIANVGHNSNRRLTVWGYAPEYHVETGFRQATRLSTSSAIFNDNHLREFFLNTYLDDLKKNQPGIFVDAITEGSFFMNDPATQAHENIPEIAAYVAENYELARDIRGVRIYRRTTNPQ